MFHRAPRLGSSADAARRPSSKRWKLSTRIAVSQLTVVLVVIGLAFWLTSLFSGHELTHQYEHRAQAVAHTVAVMPQTIAALSGTGPTGVVQTIALNIDKSTGAAFVVVVDRAGIRLSSPDPSLVGKWFHEAVVSLDGRDHLRIDPGKPAPTANARVPVFGLDGRVVGEVSVGFRESQVSAAASRELPGAALATGIGLPLAVAAAVLLARRLKRATLGLELEEIADVATQRQQLADEQAALRRVATIVARGSPEKDVFAAVAREVSQLSGVETGQLLRYEPDGSVVQVAASGAHADQLTIGRRHPAGDDSVSSIVYNTGLPARIDDIATVTEAAPSDSGPIDSRSTVGSPIIVDGRLWGVLVAARTGTERIEVDTEQRLSRFTELVATAISNAQARVELLASRRRLVSASDETRRRIERDLHDGTQQRLVTLALAVRSARDEAANDPVVRDKLVHIETGLISLLDEVREITQGIHPAILSMGGLLPALKSLARRASLPVTVEGDVAERLPASIEVATYYVVSEALANAAKYASASGADVRVVLCDGALGVQVQDDGVGGADPSGGSGLIGLRDRVEALGGSLNIVSVAGAGTALEATLPVRDVILE
jgi:signal transduction histidine kinase